MVIKDVETNGVNDASRTDRNRSLERGIFILRAFKPGTDLLGNGDLAERTGLSRATISRLTQTLVECGMLEHDRRQRAYRLAAEVLSLAHAMRSGSPVLKIASPLMRTEAEKRKINVGLAVADQGEMVYLESVRYSHRVAWRNVVAGQRVPMELTSLGRAWLSVAPTEVVSTLLELFHKRRASTWNEIAKEINDAFESVRIRRFCWAAWQPQVVALATPLKVAGHPVYVLNMSVNGDVDPLEAVERLNEPLLTLADRLIDSISNL